MIQVLQASVPEVQGLLRHRCIAMNRNSERSLLPVLIRKTLAISALSLGLWAGTGCGDPDPGIASSYGAMRSDAELRETLYQACMLSNKSQHPILLQLGADWCTDCRRVEALKSDPDLKKELERWVGLKVNVGQYDQHKWLIEHFQVTSIARWIALRPNPETTQQGCNDDPRKWIVLQDTVIEPIGDANSLKTSAEIVEWLQKARARN